MGSTCSKSEDYDQRRSAGVQFESLDSPLPSPAEPLSRNTHRIEALEADLRQLASQNQQLAQDLKQLQHTPPPAPQPAPAPEPEPELRSTQQDGNCAPHQNAQEAPAPHQTNDTRAIELLLASKQRAKADAIKREDYELAAALRDQIKSLEEDTKNAQIAQADAELARAVGATSTNSAFSDPSLNEDDYKSPSSPSVDDLIVPSPAEHQGSTHDHQQLLSDIKEVARSTVSAEPTALAAIETEERIVSSLGIGIRDSVPNRGTMEHPMSISPIDPPSFPGAPATGASAEIAQPKPSVEQTGGTVGEQVASVDAELAQDMLNSTQRETQEPSLSREARHLLDECQQVLERAQQANNKPEGWTSVDKTPKKLGPACKVDYQESAKLILVRVRCVMPVPMQTVVDTVIAGRGCPAGSKLRRLEELGPGLCHAWLSVKLPMPFKDRDFVFGQWVNSTEDCSTIVQTSLGDEAANRLQPPTKSFARGRIVMQASILTPEADGSHCYLTWLSCVDPRGKVPSAKKATAKAGADSVVSLLEACQK